MDYHLSTAPHLSRRAANAPPLGFSVSEAISVARPLGCWAGPNSVLRRAGGAAQAQKDLPNLALQQTAAAMLASRGSTVQRAAAAAELFRSASSAVVDEGRDSHTAASITEYPSSLAKKGAVSCIDLHASSPSCFFLA